MKYCALASAGVENDGAGSMSLSSLYQQKTIKNFQNSFAKGMKVRCIGMNVK